MVHFDFYDRYPDDNVVGSAISRRDGVFLSIVFHALVVLTMMYGPEMTLFELSPEELEQRQALLRERERENEDRTFVFVEPQIDMRALRPPERAPLSDIDRQAQTPERAPIPENKDPFSLGNSPERLEAAEDERARGPETPEPPQPEQIARAEPLPDIGQRPTPPPVRAGGSLGEALRNLHRYVQDEQFDNPQGGTSGPGATIQFDTKGVEFGPWIRRFVAQVRRNWFIPQSALYLSGHVVLQFNIHKNGQITDVAVAQASAIDAFNNAAYGAIVASDPTEPLPPEYPTDKAFFTVTFYYNEYPPN